MIGYLFLPTGETRQPNKGEWWTYSDGQMLYGPSSFDHAIYVRHEIDVPSGVDSLRYGFSNTNGPAVVRVGACPIPKPKRKVKKWKWVYEMSTGGRELTISCTHFATEEELRNARSVGSWCRPIPETEKEFTE